MKFLVKTILENHAHDEYRIVQTDTDLTTASRDVMLAVLRENRPNAVFMSAADAINAVASQGHASMTILELDCEYPR